MTGFMVTNSEKDERNSYGDVIDVIKMETVKEV